LSAARRIPAAAFEPIPFTLDDAGARRPFADKLNEWFEARRWQPFAFQREVWAEIGRGASGLLHAATGAGKT
jgi:ATP-dependent Lhr-like helicase